MSFHTTKTAFLAQGFQSCPLPDEQPDCPICREDFESIETHHVLMQPASGISPQTRSIR
ncbi:hypothetical protein G6011_03954 [Alternaria panax]|uniref:Uncharacterized protein n=1 Tax=Alternaria panax TaxID=48097 RepID=A0AAD4IG81_9PLEO|nr:hypothetical protein G6011_03954 [Alternaria panax]